MSLETLVVTNLDRLLGQYVDKIEIDQVELDGYARKVGIEQAIERRAKESISRKPEPVTVNIHSGIRADEQPDGSRGITAGQYNIVEVTYNGLPASDIDIFLGSVIANALEKASTPERDEAVSDYLDSTLKQELIHLADPNMPPRRLKLHESNFTYPGADTIGNHPEFLEKEGLAKAYLEKFNGRMGKLMLGNLAVSCAAASAVYENLASYREVLTLGTFFASFIVGLGITAKLVSPSYKRWQDAATETAYVGYKLNPAEIYAEEKYKATPTKKIIDASIGSYAVRHLRLIKKEKYPK